MDALGSKLIEEFSNGSMNDNEDSYSLTNISTYMSDEEFTNYIQETSGIDPTTTLCDNSTTNNDAHHQRKIKKLHTTNIIDLFNRIKSQPPPAHHTPQSPAISIESSVSSTEVMSPSLTNDTPISNRDTTRPLLVKNRRGRPSKAETYKRNLRDALSIPITPYNSPLQHKRPKSPQHQFDDFNNFTDMNTSNNSIGRFVISTLPLATDYVQTITRENELLKLLVQQLQKGK